MPSMRTGCFIPSNRPNMTKTKKRQPTTDAIEILHRRYYEGHPERLAALEEGRANAEIARLIYNMRAEAGLTQRQLAKLIGSSASPVCRLEDADYEGHSVSMLKRIATALNKKIEIQVRPLPVKTIRRKAA